MPLRKPKYRLWMPLVMLSALLLSACTQAGDRSEPAADDPLPATAVTQPEPTAQPETKPETETVSEPTATAVSPDQMVTDDGLVIFTEDDRTQGFRSLTSSWNTNWTLHTISYEEILSGGPPRDGIPSIDDPQFISLEAASEWLAGNEPVVAVDLNGDVRAYPLQILTWHEIVNDTVGEIPVIVTFCPLCNSAIVFERIVDGEAVEFGTSGLLRNSDLVMYDRKTESLWQQFTGEAIVGDQVGNRLTFLPSSLISFDDFRAAYPDGLVLSRETGIDRPYGKNPYVGYDTINGRDPFLFRGELDGRLPAVARVVTVSLEDQEVDIAYPLDILAAAGVINDQQGDQALVVFHKPGTASALGAEDIAQAEDVGATGVFDPVVEGQHLTFTTAGDGFVDQETGSTWNIVGQAIDGPLAGTQLQPIIHADHFWFSWAAFKPDTIIYQGD